MDRQQTDLLVGQFQHEFNQRASDTAAAVDRMAASDTLRRIAFDLNNGGDSAPYLTVGAAGGGVSARLSGADRARRQHHFVAAMDGGSATRSRRSPRQGSPHS